VARRGAFAVVIIERVRATDRAIESADLEQVKMPGRAVDMGAIQRHMRDGTF
jgi:hypothetical protein